MIREYNSPKGRYISPKKKKIAAIDSTNPRRRRGLEVITLKFGFAFIYPLIAAIFITQRDIITRKFLNQFDSLQIVFITSFSITVFFGFGMFLNYKPINLEIFIYIFLSAIFVTLGYYFSVLTIKAANISTTSPFRYTIIIFGIILGYFIFNEVPALNMILGSLIIMGSGIFIILRQKKIGIIK